jgi:hypothetical protein
MSLTPLPKNYALNTAFGNLTSSYPVRREISGALFILAIMWSGILALVISILIFSEELVWSNTTILVTIVIGVVFALRAYPAIALLLKQALLKESIEVTYSYVRVCRKILGLEFSKDYENEFIGGIRAVQPTFKKFELLRYSLASGLASVEVQVNGPINLIYKNKTINLGFPLDYLEGREVVETIYKSFPHYNK